MVCLFFNLALENVVKNAGIQTSGTIFYKYVQLQAYADDIDIIARFRTALKEAFLSIERAAGEMDLRINEKRLNIWQEGKVKINRGILKLRILILKLYRVLRTWAPL